jgi:hypothetical protein
MALAIHRLPYGLRDVKVATLDNTGTKGTLVDLPAAQTLEFTEETTSQTLRGDDAVVAQRVSIDNASWTLESGGISLESYTVIAGGAVTTSGVTPNVVKKWTRMNTDTYPDFFAEGQSMSESGGDHHLVLYRCKATQISGTLADGEFWVSHAEGNAIGSLNATNLGKVWEFVENETAATIV